MVELATKSDLIAVRQDLANAMTHFDDKLDSLGLRLTVRLGAMLAAGIAILATIQKLS